MPHKTLLGGKTHPLILLDGGKGGETPKIYVKNVTIYPAVNKQDSFAQIGKRRPQGRKMEK